MDTPAPITEHSQPNAAEICLRDFQVIWRLIDDFLRIFRNIRKITHTHSLWQTIWLSTYIHDHLKTKAYPLTVTNYLLCRKNPLQKQTQMPSHIMYICQESEVITIGLIYQKEKQTTFFFWFQHITTHDTILQCPPLRSQALCPCIVLVAEKANGDSCHQWIV
jgi:hypothetical protein